MGARHIGLDSTMRTATPKTIRHRLLHIAARITPTGQVIHLDTHWPWTRQLLAAINRVRAAFASLTVTKPTPAPQPL